MKNKLESILGDKEATRDTAQLWYLNNMKVRVIERLVLLKEYKCTQKIHLLLSLWITTLKH